MKCFKGFLLIMVALCFFTPEMLANETVIIPFWQHGAGLFTYFEIHNTGTANLTVQINLLNFSGSTVGYLPTSTITPGNCLQLDTIVNFGLAGDDIGSGRITLTSSQDKTIIMGCAYNINDPDFHFEIPFTRNPYGN